MSFKEMVEFLDLAWPARSTIVPCLVGPPGIGKTAAVEQHVKNVGAKRCCVIIASQILPNEVSGITMPDSETKAMEIYDHYKLGSLEDGDVLFFDELLEADQMVLSACLTLIESRRLMSGKKLPDIQIIAATNPTITPSQLKLSIRQRFVFRRFQFDNSELSEYIHDKFDVDVPSDVLDHVTTTESSTIIQYNCLTPRSLTKVVEWMCSVDTYEELVKVSQIASDVYNVYSLRKLVPIVSTRYLKDDALKRVTDVVRSTVAESMGCSNDKVDFQPSSFQEARLIIDGVFDKYAKNIYEAMRKEKIVA